MGDPRTKSSKGIITHQGHISQVTANAELVSKSVTSLLERQVTLNMTLQRLKVDI